MDKKEALNAMAYSMTERPRCFVVGGEPFFIYPATLGMIQVCTPLLQDFSINQEIALLGEAYELLRLCTEKEDRRKVAILIAYRTCKNRKEVYDTPQIEKRADFFCEHMEAEAMASILTYILDEIKCDTEDIEKFTGIAEEHRWMQKAHRAKDPNSGSLTFNGKTIYGSFIGHFCKEYGWTFQYVMWGVSYVNLKLLAADEVTTMYMSKEELHRSGVPTDRSAATMDYREAVAKYAHEFDNA
jgi:hypothetical protein